MTKARWLAVTLGLLLTALGLGVVITLWGISVATGPAFLQQVTTPYMQVQDYSLQLDHTDCNILVYGDSSAMTSADPSTIEAVTHRKTCNIAQVQSIVAVLGTLPVDLYLRHNHLPRYLVIQVAPEMFFRAHQLNKIPPVDSLTYLLRHDRGIETAELLLQYPQSTLQFVSYVLQDHYRPDRDRLASFRTTYGRSIHDYYTSRGRLTLPDRAETACGPQKPLDETADFGWLEEAKKRYAALGVKVLVILSPIPECDKQTDLYHKALDSHLEDPVNTLPLRYFNDSDRHFTPEGSTVVSLSIARQILAMDLQSSAAEPLRTQR